MRVLKGSSSGFLWILTWLFLGLAGGFVVGSSALERTSADLELRCPQQGLSFFPRIPQ